MIFFFFILIFIENCLSYDAIHESVWLRTGSNPADINRFWSLLDIWYIFTREAFLCLESVRPFVSPYWLALLINLDMIELLFWFQTFMYNNKVWLTLTDRAQIPTLIDYRSGGGANLAPPLSRLLLQIET